VSHILSEQPFSSPKDIAAQLRTSRDLVNKTLVEVLGMKNSVCDGCQMSHGSHRSVKELLIGLMGSISIYPNGVHPEILGQFER
jgi:Mn-dependent DtxR family transcriptional regulator